MHIHLQQLAKASNGLLFISESDHPFEAIQLRTVDVEKELRQLVEKTKEAVVEKLTVDYFFRNMIKTYPAYSQEQKTTAQRFNKLLDLLKKTLNKPVVYRIGEIQVDAFIIGKLSDGSFGGLRTKLIET